MTTPSKSDIEAASRIIKRAGNLITKAMILVGKDSMTLRVNRIPEKRPPANFITQPTHYPTRYPTRPLPESPRGAILKTRRCLGAEFGDIPATACTIEAERRIELAVRLAASVNHESNLPRYWNWLNEHLWQVKHHEECSLMTSSRKGCDYKCDYKCDCGFLVLIRREPAEQTYAVNVDGSMEKYYEPLSPELFLRDRVKFELWRDWHVGGLRAIMDDSPSFFTIIGEGDVERFLEFPGETELPTP